MPQAGTTARCWRPVLTVPAPRGFILHQAPRRAAVVCLESIRQSMLPHAPTARLGSTPSPKLLRAFPVVLDSIQRLDLRVAAVVLQAIIHPQMRRQNAPPVPLAPTPLAAPRRVLIVQRVHSPRLQVYRYAQVVRAVNILLLRQQHARTVLAAPSREVELSIVRLARQARLH